MSTHVEPKDIQAACAPTFSSPFPHSVSMRRMSTLTPQTPHNALLPPCAPLRESFQMRPVGSLGVHDLHPRPFPVRGGSGDCLELERTYSLISDALAYSYTYQINLRNPFTAPPRPSSLLPPVPPRPSTPSHTYTLTRPIYGSIS
ncbi:hypothetical protein B0H13DRAFT_2331059 [Mycena leptocephala]|nr:hypothetical protein B0H13DRAFT_2331059 [Mycena leptocephala]